MTYAEWKNEATGPHRPGSRAAKGGGYRGWAQRQGGYNPSEEFTRKRVDPAELYAARRRMTSGPAPGSSGQPQPAPTFPSAPLQPQPAPTFPSAPLQPSDVTAELDREMEEDNAQTLRERVKTPGISESYPDARLVPIGGLQGGGAGAFAGLPEGHIEGGVGKQGLEDELADWEAELREYHGGPSREDEQERRRKLGMGGYSFDDLPPQTFTI